MPSRGRSRRPLDWSRMNSDLFNFHTATAATSTRPSRALNRVLTCSGRFGRPAARRRPRQFVDRGMPVGVPAPSSCVGSAILVAFQAAPPCTVVRWSTRLVRSEPRALVYFPLARTLEASAARMVGTFLILGGWSVVIVRIGFVGLPEGGGDVSLLGCCAYSCVITYSVIVSV